MSFLVFFHPRRLSMLNPILGEAIGYREEQLPNGIYSQHSDRSLTACNRSGLVILFDLTLTKLEAGSMLRYHIFSRTLRLSCLLSVSQTTVPTKTLLSLNHRAENLIIDNERVKTFHHICFAPQNKRRASRKMAMCTRCLLL